MKQDDTDLDELYNRLGFLIRRAHQKASATFQVHLNGITTSQFGALNILSNKKGLDQNNLAKFLCVDKTNAGVVVKSLEKHGFITRTPSTTDRRQKILDITPSGKLAYESILANARKAHDELSSKFTKEEVAQFRSYLKRVIED
ncbi:MAG: MarR family transcriptional regulator [Sneathiella sp.]|nr:MarR family transcriptional regulator [Sneathiella sp.]